MRGSTYTKVSQINPLTEAPTGGSQYNAYSMVQVAEAIQCQKQYRHFVVVLLLAFCFMLSLELFKKSLGKRGELLTEVEIKQLYDLQYKLADLLFDAWIMKSKTVTKVVSHNKNGNCVSVFIYPYALA